MKKIYLVLIFTILLSTSSFSQGYELWGWGLDDKGQLGDFGNSIQPIPTILYLNYNSKIDFKEISLGDAYTMIIKTDGSIWGWGSNKYGQLGNGNTKDSNIPIQIGNENDWIKVSCSKAYNAEHTLAIKKDGTLWAWGKGYQSTPVQLGVDTNWEQIAAGGVHNLALKKNGTLWQCLWGSNQTTQIGIDTDWNQISVGRVHALALKKDGTLWVWGSNPYGQFGDFTVGNDATLPKKIGNNNDWLYINAGYDNSFAIKKDSSLWSWGYNYHGHLGIGNTKNQTSPQKVGFEKWKMVNAGNWHTTGIRSDGNVFTWGSNVHGQIGDGTLIDVLKPKKITTSSNWVSVHGGGGHTFAVKAPPLYSITGIVKDNNNKMIKGIEVVIKKLYDEDSYLTDLEGIFKFQNLVANEYIITPVPTTSYTFSPISRKITLNNSNIDTGIVFIAIERKFNITGKVLDLNNKPIDNIELQLAGYSSTIATSNSNGSYTFSKLLNGTYVVTPTPIKEYTFSPISKTVSILDKDITEVNFVATKNIIGVIEANDSDFDSLDIKSTNYKTKSIIVKNLSKTDELKIFAYQHSNPFVFETNLPNQSGQVIATIKPEGFYQFDATFKPSQKKQYLDSIVFSSNANSIDSVTYLTGEGIDTISSSIELEGLQAEMLQSSEITIIDLTGREIGNFNNYQVFKEELLRIKPPYLIKWLDKKGFYRFDKLNNGFIK